MHAVTTISENSAAKKCLAINVISAPASLAQRNTKVRSTVEVECNGDGDFATVDPILPYSIGLLSPAKQFAILFKVPME